MTANGSASYTYDAESRLICLGACTTPGVWKYTYDGDGKRVIKTNGSSGTLYWTGRGGNALAESDLTGNINQEYIFFNGTRIARVDRPSGTAHYYITDHLGSARMVATPAAFYSVTTQESDYSPYGIEVPVAGSDSNHYKFTGKEWDPESSLTHFWFRQDNSSLGRWLTPDPAGMAAVSPLNPQTLNRYAYVNNNPANSVDPLGLSAGDWNLIDIILIWSGAGNSIYTGYGAWNSGNFWFVGGPFNSGPMGGGAAAASVPNLGS